MVRALKRGKHLKRYICSSLQSMLGTCSDNSVTMVTYRCRSASLQMMISAYDYLSTLNHHHVNGMGRQISNSGAEVGVLWNYDTTSESINYKYDTGMTH